MSARIFVGLAPDAPAAAEIADAARRALDPKKWKLYSARDLHMTLCFLGEIDRERVEPLAAELFRRCLGSQAPALEIAGVGAFPSAARPRVVWAGVRAGEEQMVALRSLAGAVVGAVSALGLPHDEKELVPHITLARPRGRVVLEAGADALGRTWPWRPAEVLLFKSVGGSEERYPRRLVARLGSG